MKKFLTVMTLLTVIATPAFAQSFNPKDGTGNALPFAYAPHNADSSGHAAFARAPEASASAERNVSAQEPMADHGNLGGSVINGYVVDGY